MRQDKVSIGIDLGSRTTKIVRMAGGRVVSFDIIDTAHGSFDRIAELTKGADLSGSVATGYGRHLMRANFRGRVVTEITACARGASHLDPGCGTVIDIGGQDFKVIELAGGGGFSGFEMNDRCAAGTGRFMEVMSGILGYGIGEFGNAALSADSSVSISSMCTVFAESEVISLVASGADRNRIALGLHNAIADRLYTLVSKVRLKGGIMLTGGVAKNACIAQLLSKRLKAEVKVPENPQLVPAIGAALIAGER